MRVTISAGNSKLGDSVSNVSLLPVVTCNRSAGCCRNGCYARKFLRRPSVRAAWGRNTKISRDEDRFFADLRRQFGAMPPSWFRWFVGGDAPTRKFLRLIFKLADEFPDTRFLLFSKRYSWINALLRKRQRPSNLSIVLSAWPGLRMQNPHALPVAWVIDEKNPDDRIPDTVLNCPGSCEECGMCWQLEKTGFDVAFHKH